MTTTPLRQVKARRLTSSSREEVVALSAEQQAGAAGAAVQSSGRRGRIVSGFGSERIDDIREDEERVGADARERAARRREEGTRGRMTGFDGGDIDRSAGGAWHLGRR